MKSINNDIRERAFRWLEQQRQVLQFARALATVKVRGVPGQNLLHFAGTIDTRSPPLYLA